jgi:hypothetical protein
VTPEPVRPPNELRPYLLRLIGTIVVGIVVMTAVATWAWHHYGARLADAPPLPPGRPPISGVSQP